MYRESTITMWLGSIQTLIVVENTAKENRMRRACTSQWEKQTGALDVGHYH